MLSKIFTLEGKYVKTQSVYVEFIIPKKEKIVKMFGFQMDFLIVVVYASNPRLFIIVC